MIMGKLQAAILDRLKDRGLDVREIAFKDLIDGTLNLTRPAANITFNNASAKKVTMYTWKYVTTISLLLVIQWLKAGPVGDAQRKQQIYDLIEGISNYLSMQDFGLELETPLYPLGFNNITTMKLAKAGYQLYELRFWTAWNVTKEDMYPNSLDLKTIVTEFTLEPEDANAEPPQGGDVIDLT